MAGGREPHEPGLRHAHALELRAVVSLSGGVHLSVAALLPDRGVGMCDGVTIPDNY